MSSSSDMSCSGNAGASLHQAASALESALAAGNVADIPDAALQRMLAQAVRVFSVKRQACAEATEKMAIFPRDTDVTATDASIAALCMLKAVEMEVFELGLWQNWAGKI